MTTPFHNHLALFGGSFDPPHSGHVTALEGLLKDPGVGKVLVIPSFGTPLKTVETPFHDRLEMARLAFSHLAEVSDIERKENIRFTWELLERFRGTPEPVAFVIGTDQFAALRSWARFPEVLRLADWIVLLRKPGGWARVPTLLSLFSESGMLSPTPDPREWRIAGSSRVIRFVETEASEISSSAIRAALENQRPPAEGSLPEPVLRYIERKHLYGT